MAFSMSLIRRDLTIGLVREMLLQLACLVQSSSFRREMFSLRLHFLVLLACRSV